MTSIVLAAPQATAIVLESRRRRILRKLFRATERGLAILGLILLIYFAGFDLHTMTSGSMSPTLKGNGKPGSDWVLSERVTHFFRAPRRWELIAFRNAEGLQIMKRVVGLPGEKVVLKKDGTFLVDGAAVERPAAIAQTKYYAWGALAAEHSAGSDTGYFVLGDDSKDSQDSRWEKPVEPDAMNGRPLLVVWPLSRFGFVNP